MHYASCTKKDVIAWLKKQSVYGTNALRQQHLKGCNRLAKRNSPRMKQIQLKDKCFCQLHRKNTFTLAAAFVRVRPSDQSAEYRKYRTNWTFIFFIFSLQQKFEKCCDESENCTHFQFKKASVSVNQPVLLPFGLEISYSGYLILKYLIL